MGKVINNLRLYVQIGFTALTNGYVKGFAEGKIFTGPTKAVCVPGLNCYSCPGALGACPIGSLQATLDSGKFKIAFYVLGFLMIIGALFGRFVCGWLCPFGLVQDLLYKIPVRKKRKVLPGDKWLKYLKYVMLALLVVILPMFVVDVTGLGRPWFCEYVCPSGTLFAGIPLAIANSSIRSVIGFLYAWKFFILAAILVLSVFVYRPFCRYLCPLGAIYGLFNPIALARYRLDSDKCTKCGACQKACKFGIKTWETPNSPDCIRCGDCKRACPQGAICSNIKIKRKNGDTT